MLAQQVVEYQLERPDRLPVSVVLVQADQTLRARPPVEADTLVQKVVVELPLAQPLQQFLLQGRRQAPSKRLSVRLERPWLLRLPRTV